MENYFYVAANGEQAGPVSGENLKQCGVTKETLVWCSGMADWEKAGNVSELKPLFEEVPPIPSVSPVPPVPSSPVSTVSPDPSPEPVGKCPDNYLVQSILVTLLCCVPFGIVAIINAADVEKFWNRGEYGKAKEKAETAKKWCLASLICGLVVCVLAFIGGLAEGLMLM